MDEKHTAAPPKDGAEPQPADARPAGAKPKPERPRYELGDRVKMKKAHPCGTNAWEIVRTGMDFRLKCLGCGRYVLIPRTKFERAVRGRLPDAEG